MAVAINRKTSGTITGTGAIPEAEYLTISGRPEGGPTISIRGLTANGGVVNLERSLEGGEEAASFGVVEQYVADFEDKGIDVTDGAVYRLNCTTFGSGNILFTLSD